jgi:integrator complex subunit 5
MLPKLAVLAPSWCEYFGGSQALEDLIVHLALGCEQGGTQILKLLLDATSPLDCSDIGAPDSATSAPIKETSREILGNKFWKACCILYVYINCINSNVLIKVCESIL